MIPEIECDECGWQGNTDELVCSELDVNSSNPSFNICPDCGAVDTCIEYED